LIKLKVSEVGILALEIRYFEDNLITKVEYDNTEDWQEIDVLI